MNCGRIIGATGVVFTMVATAYAYWGQIPLVPGDAEDKFAVGHLPDGNYVYLVADRAYLQNTFTRTGHSEYKAVPTNPPPSFVAVWDDSLAVAGYADESSGTLQRFDPSDLDNPGFTSVSTIRTFHGVFHDATSVYVGDISGSSVSIRYVALDGTTNRVVVADISASSSPAGFARNESGDLYVGDSDDGVVYRFTASQLGTAVLSGVPLQMSQGTAVHDFGEGSNIVSVAVDGLGRIWGGGEQTGIRVYNPALGMATNLVPHLNGTRCRVTAFSVDGRAYVGCVSEIGGEPARRMYGSDLSAFYLMDHTALPFAAALGGTNPYDRGIPGWVGPHGDGKARRPDGQGGFINPANTVNPLFVSWASGATYSPAAQVIAPAWTNRANALGPAEADNTHLVSLGDLDQSQIDAGSEPGRITLAFDVPIADQEGPDFAVFENTIIVQATLGLIFGEMAYVEVSTDGTNFARFPGVALHTPATMYTNLPGGRAYAYFDPRGVYNMAGKHVNNGESWGTPFDLRDLRWHPAVVGGSVDLAEIRQVRVVDIPGSGDFLDHSVPARPVLDGWLTYGSGGADIDAVGVINFKTECLIEAGAPGGVISWSAVTNRSYRVQWTDSLSDGAWQDLGDPVIGDGMTHEVADNGKADGVRFYRVLRSLLP